MNKEPDLFISSGLHEDEGIRHLNELFLVAAQQNVADIHFLFQEQKVEIKFRVQGELCLVDLLDQKMAKLIDEKIRARANMAVSDRSTPLDGRMRLRYDNRVIDVRVSVVPVISGQKIVCRILDQSNSARRLDSIEMTPAARLFIDELINEPTGLLLVCGPTGSGKTTTLYAIISELHNGKRNIVTIENPVEYVIPGIAQINIDQHINFASALRAVLRQDPDVILVGEIRDAETAEIAMQAANTGHLVLATVHSNNATMAITRMVDLGLDPDTLCASLRGVIAQRLLKRLDPSTEVQWVNPEPGEIEWMQENAVIYKGRRLPKLTEPPRYAGVAPVMEMIRMDAKIRSAVINEEGEAAIIDAAARQPQFETLAQAAVRMSCDGVATFDQVKDLCGSDNLAPTSKRVCEILIDRDIIEYGDMMAAVNIQQEMKRRGVVCHLGEILVYFQSCTTEEIIDAIGLTDGAVDFMKKMARTRQLDMSALMEIQKKWRTLKGSSFFDICIKNNIVTKEELYEPTRILGHGYEQLFSFYPNEGEGAEARSSVEAAVQSS